MANSLLDFVISLVRDPDAAARYAANPAQSIADAHLTGVTSADVNNLIPMVSDSLSMGAPAGAAAGTQVADHGNVWASGAATAALDAFTPHTPIVVAHQGPASGVISHPATPGPGEVPQDPQPMGFEPHEPSVLLTGAELPEDPIDHGVFGADVVDAWDHSVVHPHPDPDHHDFGLHG
ncbi:Rv0340 family IniB-related protein [Mycobacterium riyadhense]|uniref:Rv0340 family IniB-related protein n=1 Tax=Mycobacterium riyadhense TaxID=486698 RepID=UPI0019526A97|nr:Rv0340 family IniB-related protein [Mycobacterium riyadhense]